MSGEEIMIRIWLQIAHMTIGGAAWWRAKEYAKLPKSLTKPFNRTKMMEDK